MRRVAVWPYMDLSTFKDADTDSAEKQLPPQKRDASQIYFREGDVWWYSPAQQGRGDAKSKTGGFKRPVIVIKKLSSELCITLPLSAQKKEGSWFTEISCHGEPQWVLLYQIQTIHKSELREFLGRLEVKDLVRVKEKLSNLLELS